MSSGGRAKQNTATVELPFPPASLSGHNTGHWRARSAIIKKHRDWARLAALGIPAPDDGVIPIQVTFHPPNRRGDELNYMIRVKPYFDGIADALGLNDKRFRPTFIFAEPEKPGRVEIVIGGGS